MGASTTYPTNLAFGGENGKTLYVVGRCADASYGQGHGCAEGIDVDERGREWTWLMGSDDQTPSTTTAISSTTAATTAIFPQPSTVPSTSRSTTQATIEATTTEVVAVTSTTAALSVTASSARSTT